MTTKSYKSSERYQDNNLQIETNRKEAKDVKNCFTTQTHQTIITCSAVLGIVIGFVAKNPNYLVILISSLTLIVLCLTTISVGCHKFNTANRAIAYQIHLSRIDDYNLNSYGKNKIADALKAVDWEEAMFAYRIVQPMIYKFFYSKKLIRKDKKKKTINNLKKYPWYDSRELINVNINNQKYYSTRIQRWFYRIYTHTILSLKLYLTNKVQAKFYPGTYLRKMIYKLSFVTLILTILYSISVYNLFSLNGNDLSDLRKSILVVISLLPIFYILYHVFDGFIKCRRLESGLTSIQSSAFVWRIVTISHLLAKCKIIKINKESTQIYNGYTRELASIAKSKLYPRLDIIHDYLNVLEKYIIKTVAKENISL